MSVPLSACPVDVCEVRAHLSLANALFSAFHAPTAATAWMSLTDPVRTTSRDGHARWENPGVADLLFRFFFGLLPLALVGWTLVVTVLALVGSNWIYCVAALLWAATGGFSSAFWVPLRVLGGARVERGAFFFFIFHLPFSAHHSLSFGTVCFGCHSVPILVIISPSLHSRVLASSTHSSLLASS